MTDLAELYRERFGKTGLEKRQEVWCVLCDAYFSKLIPADSTILDVACGYGEFTNNIAAKKKYAVDLNPDASKFLDKDVVFNCSPATDLSSIAAESIDVAFSSNFLEHLRSKEECSRVLLEIHRTLKPGGRLILMGPNIRFTYRNYWDFYDHYLPLSDASLSEGLVLNGYKLDKVVPQFLPYTMNGGAPTAAFLIRAYLALPIAWRFMGGQFLIVARK